MVLKLSKHDSGLALVLDPATLRELQIDESTELEVSTNGRVLVIAPVEDAARHARFETALQATNEQFGNALRRLAE